MVGAAVVVCVAFGHLAWAGALLVGVGIVSAWRIAGAAVPLPGLTALLATGATTAALVERLSPGASGHVEAELVAAGLVSGLVALTCWSIIDRFDRRDAAAATVLLAVAADAVASRVVTATSQDGLELAVIGLALVVTIALLVIERFLSRARSALVLRAAASDPRLVARLGLPLERARLATWLIGATGLGFFGALLLHVPRLPAPIGLDQAAGWLALGLAGAAIGGTGPRRGSPAAAGIFAAGGVLLAQRFDWPRSTIPSVLLLSALVILLSPEGLTFDVQVALEAMGRRRRRQRRRAAAASASASRPRPVG